MEYGVLITECGVLSTEYRLRWGKVVVVEGDYGLQTTDYGLQRAEGKGLCAL